MNNLLDPNPSMIPPPPPLSPPPPEILTSKTDPRRIHAQAIKIAHTDLSIYNNLITLYSKSDLLSYSARLFNQIPFPNIVSWTSLISAHSNTPPSLKYFISMLRHSAVPNQRTLATLFKTCASLTCLSFGLALHSLALKLSLSVDPFSGSALINFYSKCRLPYESRKVFDEMPLRDGVCYSAMIVGLAQNSLSIDALLMFSDMRCFDVASTMHSVSGALRAASELAAFDQCRIIHAHAVTTGLHKSVIVGSALIDGYGKSGLVMDARQIFDENLLHMNIVGWNAIMAAYAQQGDIDSVLQLFYSMKFQELFPDEYSFLAILASHCNAGLVEETEMWLTKMKVEYGVEPRLEHYTCLIGAMGKVGRLKDAEMIANTMPFVPDAAVWRALLSSSAYHSASDMAQAMAKRLMDLDPQDDSAYVIAANALSSAKRWEEVAEVRKTMKDRSVRKEGGRSWIEVRGKVHVFLAGDRSHERAKEIYEELEKLIEKIEKLGYAPIWDEMLHGVGEKEKREALWYHSEKLALAFGMVSGAAPPGKALRIVKNLRTCRDCHEVFKYASRVLGKEIIVRDVNRYHRILDGKCTCDDIW